MHCMLLFLCFYLVVMQPENVGRGVGRVYETREINERVLVNEQVLAAAQNLRLRIRNKTTTREWE